MAGVKDSNFVFTKIVELNLDGNFTVDSLFFFDSIALNFQINRENDGNTKNIKLRLSSFIPPYIDSSTLNSNWQDDNRIIGGVDTAFTKAELDRYERSKLKMLKPVTVKAWKTSRKELDDRYATGIFSEPTPLSYDVRLDKSVRTIWQYLRKNLPGFIGGPDIGMEPKFNGKDALFFVDGEPQSVEDIGDYWYEGDCVHQGVSKSLGG